MTTDHADLARALDQAAALCDLGRHDDAAAAAAQILTGDPDNASALCLLARARLGQGDDDGALRAAHRAILAAPEQEWAHRLGSIALCRLGRPHDAVAFARTAVRLAPHSAPTHTTLARALAADHADLAEARAAAERAVALAPNDTGSHHAVATVAFADKRYDDATAALHQVLALDPDHSAAHNDLARVQLKRSRFGRACGLATSAGGFSTAIRTNPTGHVGRRNLDLVLNVFLRRAAYCIFIVAYIASQAYSDDKSTLTRVGPALLLTVPVFFVVRFLRALTPPLRSHLLRLTRQPLIRAALFCDAAAAISLIVGALLAHASSAAFGCGAAAALLARVILWRHTSRLRSRRSLGRHL